MRFCRSALAPRAAGVAARRRRKCLCAAHAHVHSACAAFAAGAQLAAHTQPALRSGFMAPARRLLRVSRRAIPDLTLTWLRCFC